MSITHTRFINNMALLFSTKKWALSLHPLESDGPMTALSNRIWRNGTASARHSS